MADSCRETLKMICTSSEESEGQSSTIIISYKLGSKVTDKATQTSCQKIHNYNM